MNRLTLLALAAIALVLAPTRPAAAAGPNVLLVTASNGFVHDVVKPVDGDSTVYATVKSVVENDLGGTLTRTADAAALTAELLDPEKTRLLVFYTTGDLPEAVPNLLQGYLEAGGAMLGIHPATDTAKDSPAFANLIGGSFDGHPWDADTPVVLRRVDDEHAAVRALGGRLALREEIYLHKNFDASKVRVLEVLDMEETQQKQPRYVPVVWCKQVGDGRLLYTALGHRPDVWSADWYRRHLADSMKWLLGDAPGSADPNPRESGREEKLAKTAFQRWQQEQAGREPGQSPREPRRVPESPDGNGNTNGNSGGGIMIAADAPATRPDAPDAAGAPRRGRDPWVFRCVLDGRPRVTVVALSPEFWAAWDTADCGIYKVWRGGMDLTGSVYDTKHGPQPRATGTVLAGFGEGDAWELVTGERATPAAPRFLGYAVEGESSVTFRYAFALPGGGTASVTESPQLRGDALVRTFTVSGLPEGTALQCRLDSGGGEHAVENATSSSQRTGRGEIALLRLDRDGTAVATSRWPDAGDDR